MKCSEYTCANNMNVEGDCKIEIMGELHLVKGCCGNFVSKDMEDENNKSRM